MSMMKNSSRTLYSIIILVLSLTVTLSSTIASNFRQFTYGKTLCCITPLDVIFGYSPLDCVKYCLSRRQCAAISYQRKSLQCRLFPIDSSMATFEEDDPSYVMTYKNAWSEDQTWPCSKRSCSEIIKCVAQETPNRCVQSDTPTQQWTLIYETDDTGDVVSGTENNLRKAIQSVSVLQVYVPSWNETFIIDTTVVDGDNHSCSQSLFQLTKQTWNTFSEDAIIKFHIFCRSGYYYTSQHHLGDDSRPNNPYQFGTVGTKWFTRNWCQHQERYPIYCNDETGKQSCGSFTKLHSALLHGSEVRINIINEAVSHILDQVIIKDTVISAQMLRWIGGGVGMKIDHEPALTNAVWSYNILNTHGNCHKVEWYVGTDISKSFEENQKKLHWYADTCWQSVYSHDKNGIPLDGSIQRLRASVLAGKRIRLVTNVAVEPDIIITETNGQVVAQLLSQISVTGKTYFQKNPYWFWQMFSSTGFQYIMRIHLGSAKAMNTDNRAAMVKWYADSRPWRQLLTISASGIVTMGTKGELYRSLKSGGMLRIVVTFLNGTAIAFTPSNTHFYREEVSAQFIRYVGHVTKAGSSKRIFSNPPYWNLILVTTEGKLTSSLRFVGSHKQISTSTINVTSAWFVN